MATTRQKLQTKTSLAQEMAALKQRVTALERLCASKESVDALATAQRRADQNQREHEEVHQHLEAATREVRRKAIAEFNRRYWDEKTPGLAAVRRERLAALNAHLAARGMEPEPVR